jgi:hypothetical protein
MLKRKFIRAIKRMKNINGFFISILLIVGCGSGSEPDPINKEVTVTYLESQEDFPNPERGFYHYSETSASSFNPLSQSVLESYRNAQKSSGSSYSVVSTLVFRYFVLDAFRNTALSETFVNNVISDLATARAAGVKIVPRFTYTVSVTSGPCPESFICPPYGDASKEIVLQHIEQLRPVFQQNADVIACVQMGFIGTWGENYYTDFFGDASSNGQEKLLDNNWTDRITVLQALLDAIPDEIMVQVRYPQLKQRFVYGITAPVSSAPLMEGEAFSGTDKARIGFHNDCFLASADDFGTYEDYGNSTSPRATANTTLRKYFSDDSKFVVVGGETCSDGYSPQNDCEPAGKAETEMRNLHFSFLNMDYNNQVNNDWVAGGCMENIKKNLGYRFVLQQATFPSVVKRSDSLKISLQIENKGYASPFNARPVELILRSANGSSHSFTFNTAIQKWFPGTIQINQSFSIADVVAGDYELLLNLPDQHASINKRVEYAIRFANENTWEETSGYNKLNYTVRIQ